MSASARLVSVVIPTFDRLRCLRSAIDSVLSQTYAAWELVVVDDGSTDGTPEYLSSLAEPRIRTLRVRHTGNPALLRNAGVRASRGELIAFLDSDDAWLPRKLATQVAGFAAEPACRWRSCGFARIDSDGGPPPPGGPWPVRRGWVLEPLLRLEAVVPTPTVMVERSLFEEVGGFDESLRHVQDYDLWFRLAARSPLGLDEDPLALIGVSAVTHTSDRLAVNRAWARVYRKAASAVGPELAAICRARRTEHLILAARVQAAGGEPLRALGTLLGQAGRGWRRRDWWRATAAAAARGTLPRAVVERWRAWRRAGAPASSP